MSVRSELSVGDMIMRRCLSNVAVRYFWLADVGRTAPLRCVQVNQNCAQRSCLSARASALLKERKFYSVGAIQ
jgi:hypothetical protein